MTSLNPAAMALMPYRPGEIRVVKRPAASLRVCLMTLFAPSFSNEMSAPDTGLPLLSRTAPVIVARFPLLALALGWTKRPAENTTRSRLNNLLPKLILRNVFPVMLTEILIATKPPYVAN